MRATHAIAVLAVGAAIAIVGCGDSDNSSSGGLYGSGGSTTTTSSARTTSGGAAVVSTADVPKLGRILVDAKGFTLYDFHKDKGTKSACNGACAKLWPPLTTEGAPQPRDGASASMLGTSKRSDGTTQVTYAGQPLYTYAADTKPGDAKGNDFDSYGGEWYALQPNGQEP